jgi:hypothetical protein
MSGVPRLRSDHRMTPRLFYDGQDWQSWKCHSDKSPSFGKQSVASIGFRLCALAAWTVCNRSNPDVE